MLLKESQSRYDYAVFPNKHYIYPENRNFNLGHNGWKYVRLTGIQLINLFSFAKLDMPMMNTRNSMELKI